MGMVTASALTSAKMVLIRLRTPKPRRRRTCTRSFVTRLMISPVLMRR
jgi:hypothetical protein